MTSDVAFLFLFFKKLFETGQARGKTHVPFYLLYY